MTLALVDQGMLPSPCVGICRIDETTGWCASAGAETGFALPEGYPAGLGVFR
jgi:Protein of unknown function (DUF1289)